MSNTLRRMPAAPAPKTGRFELFLLAGILFMCTGPFPFVFQNVDPHNPFSILQEKSLYIYFKIAAILPAVWLGLSYRSRLADFIRTNLSLLLFVLVMWVSSMWAASTYYAARTAFDMTMTLFVCATIASLYDRAFVVSVLGTYFQIIVVLSLIWIVFVPSQGIHHADDVFGANIAGSFRGIYIHKNAFGQCVALSTIFFMLRMKPLSDKITVTSDHVFFVVSAALLYFSKCTSGFLMVAFALLFMTVIKSRGSARVIIAASLIAGGVLYLGFLSEINSVIFSAIGKDATFTGRTEGWSYILTLVGQRPLFGFGYGATGNVQFRLMLMTAVFNSFVDSHNGYLETLVSLGLAGFVPFLWWCGVTFARGLRAAEASEDKALEQLTILMAAWLVAALSEVTAFSSSSPVSVSGFVAASVLSMAYYRRRSVSRAHRRMVAEIPLRAA
jgi:exopolysaccharide production protein ExoQ